MDVVARDADVVGRRVPAQVDAVPGGRGRQAAGHARRRRVRGRGRARLVRGRPEIPGAVLGDHPIVVGAGREPAVRVARSGRLGNPVGRAGREPGRGRAVDVVPEHADVVRCRAPAQVDLAETAGRRQRSRRARRRRVGVADRGAHVLLDLGRAEGAVVDAHLVDQAAEVLAPDVVAADSQRRRRAHQRSGGCGASRRACRSRTAARTSRRRSRPDGSTCRSASPVEAVASLKPLTRTSPTGACGLPDWLP